jgi:hypothetical protein
MKEALEIAVKKEKTFQRGGIMQETKLLEDQITGLRAKIKALRTDKDAFIKAQGMAQEAERMRGDAEKKREEVTILKTANAALITKKNAEVAKGLSGMIGKMKEVLPEGEPVLMVEEEGNVFIGWQRPGGSPVAYSGLSGGERVAFDAALTYALKANIIISEFAELDDEHLPMAMDKFAKMDVQCLLSTCHPPKEVGKDWTVVNL